MMLPQHLRALARIRTLGVAPASGPDRKRQADPNRDEPRCPDQKPPRWYDAKGNELRSKPQ